MQPLELKVENIQKAREYLESIGMLSEFNKRGIDPSQWVSVIQFANQQINARNQNNQ